MDASTSCAFLVASVDVLGVAWGDGVCEQLASARVVIAATVAKKRRVMKVALLNKRDELLVDV